MAARSDPPRLSGFDLFIQPSSDERRQGHHRDRASDAIGFRGILVRWPGRSGSCPRPATASQRRDSDSPPGLLATSCGKWRDRRSSRPALLVAHDAARNPRRTRRLPRRRSVHVDYLLSFHSFCVCPCSIRHSDAIDRHIIVSAHRPRRGPLCAMRFRGINHRRSLRPAAALKVFPFRLAGPACLDASVLFCTPTGRI